jgi:hypothetical protein
MTTEKMAFLRRCKEFFGLRPAQSLKGFAEELKELSDQDKLELCRLFNEAGLATELPLRAPQLVSPRP